MNTVLLSILLLLAMSSHVTECACRPNYCDTVKCPVLTLKKCPAGIVPKGGVCGCCNSCNKILSEGVECLNIKLRGEGHKVICAAGLFCNTGTGKCTKLVI